MSRVDLLVNVLPAIPILLAHLAGVVVSMVLLIRQEQKPTPVVLALIGFGLLFALDLAQFAREPLIRWLLHRTAIGNRAGVAGVRCCCGIFDVVGIVCLIIAIGSAVNAWQASSSSDV